MIPTHNGLIVKGVLTFPWTVVGRGFRYVIATIFGYIHAQDGEGSLCPALVSLLNKLAPFAHHTCLGAGSLCLVSVARQSEETFVREPKDKAGEPGLGEF